MKLKNKNLLALLAAGLSLSVFSCDKEETIQDLELPTVQLTVSGNPAKLFNEVKLSATATDNGAVSRVVYFINNDSVGVATEKPFEVNWNTKAVADGKYMLKAVAYDLNNNKGEAAQEVNINNTLLKAFIDEGYIAARNNKNQEYEEWIFLSDKEGKTLGAAKQITNEPMISWERPNDFYSDTIYLNKVYKRIYTPDYEGALPSNYYSLNTYPNLSLDEIQIKGYPGIDSVGSVGITVNNNFDGSKSYEYKTVVPGFSTSMDVNYNSISYNVSMNKSQAKGLTTYGIPRHITNGDYSREKFFRVDELAAGNNYSFHVDGFNPMTAQKMDLPGNFLYIYFGVMGYFSGDSETPYSLDDYFLWNGNYDAPAEIDAFYADNVFSDVRTYLGGSVGNKSFYIYRNSKLPQILTIPDLSLNISDYSTKNIEVSTKGNVDAGGISWIYTNQTETEFTTATKFIYLLNEPANYKLPEVPAEILSKFPVLGNTTEFKYDYTYLIDNLALSSYEEMLQFWFTDKLQGKNLSESTSLYISPETEGGRIQNKPTDLKADMKREELRSKGIWY